MSKSGMPTGYATKRNLKLDSAQSNAIKCKTKVNGFLVEHECQNERAQALVRFGSIPCDFDIFQFEKYKITVGSIKCN